MPTAVMLRNQMITDSRRTVTCANRTEIKGQ
jgi:hypothetical protein